MSEYFWLEVFIERFQYFFTSFLETFWTVSKDLPNTAELFPNIRVLKCQYDEIT